MQPIPIKASGDLRLLQHAGSNAGALNAHSGSVLRIPQQSARVDGCAAADFALSELLIEAIGRPTNASHQG